MQISHFNVNIGKSIRNQREKLGYSREKLAELASMSDGYLGEVERGEKSISSYFLYNLSKALGVTMDFLVSGWQDSNNHMSKELETIINFLRISDESELLLIEKIVRIIVKDD